MIQPTETLGHIGSEDRVLFLGIPTIDILRDLCARAGIVMCIGEREAVYEARKAARDLNNVMFHPGEANDLPFDDGYLTQVVSLSGTWDAPEPIAREIARVLAGGGFVHVATENSELFRTAGWREEPAAEGFAVFCKPGEQRPKSTPVQLPVLR